MRWMMSTVYLFLMCASSMASSGACVFVAFEVTDRDRMIQFSEKAENSQFQLDGDEYLELVKLMDIHSTCSVSFTNLYGTCDRKYRVQYVQENGGSYDLVCSDLYQGLKCDIVVETIPEVGFMLHGNAEYFTVSMRETWHPFPKLNAGYPKRMMGGQFDSDVLLPRDKHAVICAYMKSIKKGRLSRITGLIVFLQGDILELVDPHDVAPAVDLFNH